MSDATTYAAPGAYPDFDPRLSPLAIALMERRLAELRRLSDLALDRVKYLELVLDGKVGERERKLVIGKGGIGMEFPRALRCFRQVIALEMELLGLRDAPDRSEPTNARDAGEDSETERPERSDLNDLGDLALTDRQLLGDLQDYRKGPIDIVVAEIRETLGVAPPEDDPFAPPPERRAAKPQPDARPVEPPAVPQNPPSEPGPQPAAKAAPARAKGRTRPTRPLIVAAPAKPRRAITRLLSGAAHNRGPPR